MAVSIKNHQKKNLIYFLLLLITFSCVNADNKNNSKGKYIKDIENKDGTITQEEYLDGKLKSKFNIKDKKRVGIGYVYYPSGKVQSKYNYVNGELEGESYWYYESGKVYEIKNYKRHLKEGIQKTFYEDGSLKSEVTYKKDIPIPGLKEYNNKGKLLSQAKLILYGDDRTVYENKYFIRCKMSEKTARVRYYKVLKFNDNEESTIELNSKNNIGECIIAVAPGYSLMEDVLIRAETKTTFGNTLVLEKKFRVAIDN